MPINDLFGQEKLIVEYFTEYKGAIVMDEFRTSSETDDRREIIKQKLRQYYDGRIVRKDLTKSIKEQIEMVTDCVHQIVMSKAEDTDVVKKIKQLEAISEKDRDFLYSAYENRMTSVIQIGHNGRRVPFICKADEKIWKVIFENQPIPSFQESELLLKLDYLSELCFQCALAVSAGKECVKQMQVYIDAYLRIE